MPHISLSLYTGRSKEELDKIADALQKCLMETAGWKPEAISVSIEEIEANTFIQKVQEK